MGLELCGVYGAAQPLGKRFHELLVSSQLVTHFEQYGVGNFVPEGLVSIFLAVLCVACVAV